MGHVSPSRPIAFRLPLALVLVALSPSTLAGCAGSSPSSDSPPAPTTTATHETATASATATTTESSVASATPEPTPPPEPQPIRVRYYTVGDVMLGRRVQKTIDEKGDMEWPFRPMAQFYSDVDFTFANLENAFFSGKNPNVTPPGKHYAVLYAKPEHAKSLVKYKFTAVNLANNHAMDQDLKGLKETLSTLDAAGIVHTGTGLDLDAAWTPMYVDVRGLKIGFIGASYTSKNDEGQAKNPYVARIEDEKRLDASIKAAREKANFVVVTFHAGDEHKFKPNDRQKKFVRAAVRSGADIVMGGHAHVVQPAEKIDGKWVFYSMGNYIFDQPAFDNSESVGIELRLVLAPGEKQAKIEKLLLHPIFIKDCAPAPADEAHAKRVLEHMKVYSGDTPPPLPFELAP